MDGKTGRRFGREVAKRAGAQRRRARSALFQHPGQLPAPGWPRSPLSAPGGERGVSAAGEAAGLPAPLERGRRVGGWKYAYLFPVARAHSLSLPGVGSARIYYM